MIPLISGNDVETVRGGCHICCICGSKDTYIRPTGEPYWHGHTCDKEYCTRFECHECFKKLRRDNGYKIKDDMRQKKLYIICAMSGSTKTGMYNLFDEADWRRDKHRTGSWDGKSYLCARCDGIVRSNLPNSQKNITKTMRDCRLGILGKYVSQGKAAISQWIVAKTLGIKDMNIENNNFREHVDLSKHIIFGMIDVKSATFSTTYDWWSISSLIKIDENADNIVIVCMDKFWENVERVYIIPINIIKYKSMTIVKQGGWYEEFRVGEKPYNDTYHSVDIPDKFSPFDLWKGKYGISK